MPDEPYPICRLFFETVMQETWEVVEAQDPQHRTPGLYANGRLVWEGLPGNTLNRNRFEVAVMGKQALEILLELEWAGTDYDQGYDEYLTTCPSCGGYHPGQRTRRKNLGFGHRANCALGALCERVRAIPNNPAPPPEPEPVVPRTSWEHLDDEEPGG
jgi:hypothetical protein